MQQAYIRVVELYNVNLHIKVLGLNEWYPVLKQHRTPTFEGEALDIYSHILVRANCAPEFEKGGK